MTMVFPHFTPGPPVSINSPTFYYNWHIGTLVYWHIITSSHQQIIKSVNHQIIKSTHDL